MRTIGRAGPATALALLVVACLPVACCTGSSSSGARAAAVPPATAWLCQPGTANDPCAVSLATMQVAASGATTLTRPAVATAASRFDCFYVYPRVGPAGGGTGAGPALSAESALAAAARQEAARFSQVCRVWAPVYQQGAADDFSTAAGSVQAAFEDYLAHDNDGWPIIFIGHSEGAATLIDVLSRLLDGNPGLRRRLVLAILLGGNVEVPARKLTGGSFRHIPLCITPGQAGCVIAYSSFPGTPPAGSMFGRPGQGISLSIGQTATSGLQVACVNPAAIGGGAADLDPIFSTQTNASSGQVGTVQETAVTTPWVAYPGLYRAACEHADGASWLQVSKATGPADQRPTVTEAEGTAYGYHPYDVNLALGNLVTDITAAEATWRHHTKPQNDAPAAPERRTRPAGSAGSRMAAAALAGTKMRSA
jgi:hypothetical protein